MSENNITTNNFLGNSDVPTNIKLAVLAMAKGGTCELYRTKMGVPVFVSQVFRKDGRTPVQFTFGDNSSLSEMACRAALKGMKMDAIFGQNLDVLFNNSMSDEEIIEKIAIDDMDSFNINSNGLKELYSGSSGIKEKIEDFFKAYRENDSKAVDSQTCEDFVSSMSNAFENVYEKKNNLAQQLV